MSNAWHVDTVGVCTSPGDLVTARPNRRASRVFSTEGLTDDSDEPPLSYTWANVWGLTGLVLARLTVLTPWWLQGSADPKRHRRVDMLLVLWSASLTLGWVEADDLLHFRPDDRSEGR